MFRIVDTILGAFFGIIIGFFIGVAIKENAQCTEYNKEVSRIEKQRKDSQERFDKWCQTNKSCRYMKENYK